MHTPRPALIFRSTRLLCESLEERLQLDSSLWSHLVPGTFVTDHILVQFKPDAIPSQIPGTSIVSSLSLVPGLYEVQLSQAITMTQALDAYLGQPEVISAQPDYLVQAEALPNDPSLNQQWALKSSTNQATTINAITAWDTTTGSGRTIVAVIDTGIDTTHPDLAANLWRNTREIAGNGVDDDGNGFVDDFNGYNFVSNTGNVRDDNGHGTHVSGILGAVGNNGIGVTGVNWNVQIMALKFLDAGGRGSTSNALRALNYAVQMGATISNNSWTAPAYDSLLEAGIRNAGLAGHIYVAAAGNLGRSLDTSKLYPASFPLDNVVTVAAVDSSNRLASWSNYGLTVDIAAPGVNIYSTMKGASYGSMSGTSMATPFVTGALALVRDANPAMTATQVIQRVLSTADKLPSLTGKIAGGRLNVGASIGANSNPPPPPALDVTGAKVLGLANLISNNKLTGLRVTINEAIQPGSFDLNKVLNLSGPSGSLSVTTVRPVSGNNTQFDILFPEQTQTGTYSVILDTGIQDAAGNPLNQNGNAINGEMPADRYAGSVNFTTSNVYAASGLPALVRDYSVNTYSMTIPDSMVIGAVRVQLSISHGWMSDMVIKLRSPSGTEVLLANRRGSGGKGYNNTILDDAAIRSIQQGSGLFTGSYRPENALSKLKGSPTNGTWTLIVEDKARGDGGTILNWTLTFDASAGSSSNSMQENKPSITASDLLEALQSRKITHHQTQKTVLAAMTAASAQKLPLNSFAFSCEETSFKSPQIKRQQHQLFHAWQMQLGFSGKLRSKID